ncbi:MAG TPA: S41 family peptidase [Candidatus Obscuribacterales bacterium]
MRRFSWLFVSALLALAPGLPMAAMGAAAALSQPALKKPPVATPEGVYHHVWQIVEDNYFDPTYHGQDWKRWQHRYDEKLKSMDDAHKAIDTMLASLSDRYTRYLDPTAFDDEKAQITATLCGVGLQLGNDKNGKVVVIAPIEGMPAAKAGLMPNDEIVEVDGKPINGLSVEQVSKRIRGDIDTHVKLAVMRDAKRLEFDLTRAEIPLRSVHAVQMLDDNIGYLQLSTFMSERAGEEVREALEKLSPARGLIIDLRNNPGGLVTNAIAICSMFLDGGHLNPVIVSTIDRSGKPVHTRTIARPISHQPIVILINGGSASAAEITSGCLHDSQRAQLVGQKSFGKGLVQSITRLEDGGGVNVTIARYVTPNNTDIHKKGIVPDFDVELQTDDYAKGRGPWFIYRENREPPPLSALKDLQLKKAVDVLEHTMAQQQESIAFPSLKLNPFPNIPSPGVGLNAP